MKKYQQLEKMFGREVMADEACEIASIFGQSIDFLSTEAPANTPIQPFSKMPLKSVITNKTLRHEELEYHWQEFALDRQSLVRDKREEMSNYPGYIHVTEKLYDLLDKVKDTMGEKMFDNLQEAITDREVVVTYLHYNKGFFDGIKFAMMMGQF